MPRPRHAAGLLAALATLVAADCRAPKVPPLAPAATNAWTPGRVVWHDLVTHDLARAQRFYGELFGWEFEKLGGKRGTYVLARHQGAPVAGLLQPADPREEGSQWVSFFSTTDVDGAVARVRAAGGRTLLAPEDVPDRGRLAVVADPAGALVGLVRAQGGDPRDSAAAINRWLWTEYWARDTTAARVFYGPLFGWTSARDTVFGAGYALWTRDGRPRAGLMRIPQPDIRPNWLPTIRVRSVAELVAKVPALGGRVIYAPRPETRNGTVAIIADPTDAAVTIQEWEPRP